MGEVKFLEGGCVLEGHVLTVSDTVTSRCWKFHCGVAGK